MSRTLLLLFLMLIASSPSVLVAKKGSPKVGQSAPSFSLKSLGQEKELSLSSFRGKVVLVDFWASWCLPCKHSLPMLEEIAQSNPDIAVLAVSIDDIEKNALEFWEEREGPLALYDSQKEVVKAYDILGMPSAFIIDKEGVLRKRFDGYSVSKMKKIKAELKKWL